MPAVENDGATDDASDVSATATGDFFGELLLTDRSALQELDLDELMGGERLIDGILEPIAEAFVANADQRAQVVGEPAQVLSLLAAEVAAWPAVVRGLLNRRVDRGLDSGRVDFGLCLGRFLFDWLDRKSVV